MNTITQGIIFKARCAVSEVEDVRSLDEARELLDRLARRVEELISEIEVRHDV